MHISNGAIIEKVLYSEKAIQRLTKIAVKLSEGLERHTKMIEIIQLQLESHEYEHHGIISDRDREQADDLNGSIKPGKTQEAFANQDKQDLRG